MENWTNRVFGGVIIKSINSNYNADFSEKPRTLPNCIVYETDKAYKYKIKYYLNEFYSNDKIFYLKSLNTNLNPLSLDETYKKLFGDYPLGINNDKAENAENAENAEVVDEEKGKGNGKGKGKGKGKGSKSNEMVKGIVLQNLFSC